MLGCNVISCFSVGFGTLKRSSICEEGLCQLMFDTLWCEREQVWSAIFILSKLHCVHGGQSNRKSMTCIVLDKKNEHISAKVVVAQCKSLYCSAVTAQQETEGNHMQGSLTMVDSELCAFIMSVAGQTVRLCSTSKELFFLP